jgi:hypothetical protein
MPSHAIIPWPRGRRRRCHAARLSSATAASIDLQDTAASGGHLGNVVLAATMAPWLHPGSGDL